MPNKATTKTTATSSNPRSTYYVPKTTTTSSTSGTKSTTPTTPTSTKPTSTAAAQTAANIDTLHAQTSPAFGGPTYTPASTSTSTKSSTTANIDTLHAQTSPAFGGATTGGIIGTLIDAVKAKKAAEEAAKAREEALSVPPGGRGGREPEMEDPARPGGSYGNSGNSGGSGGSGGSSGYDADTATLQQQLNNAGASIAVDGIWGPETQAAYEAYINQIYNYGGGGSGGGGGFGSSKKDNGGEYPISQLSAVMGALLPGYINPIGSPELENLHMGDRYDLEYDYDNILNILDNATKNKYNELWNQYSQTENAYYNQNLADQSATLDTIKRAQAAATMSGASKGMQAAQMLSSILTGQQTNAGNQLELANVRNNTALSEQTELAENKNTALTTSNAVKQAIAGLDETKYGYDAQMRIGDQDYNAAIANAIGTILAQGVYAGTLDISDYEALLNSLYPQP